MHFWRRPRHPARTTSCPTTHRRRGSPPHGPHRGKTITLKLRYSDFSTHTRSHTLDHFTDSEADIYAIAARLLEEHPREQALRLLGISVSNLDMVQVGEGGQLTLEF